MYDTILFDLDGTISNSAEGIISCAQYALSCMGISAEKEELYCFIGPPMSSMFMKKYGMDAETAQKAVAKYRELYSAEGMYKDRMYDGVEELLKKLKAAGKRLAVATSKSTDLSKKIIELYGLSELFDLVLGSEIDGRRNTKAEVIADALSELGIDDDKKSTAVMVGDRFYDVEGAAKCGLDCIGVYYGFAEPGELEKAGAVHTVKTVAELGEFLLK